MQKVDKMYIWLDDERPVNWERIPESMPVSICRDYQDVILVLEQSIPYVDIIIIDFDHDLGIGKTGYDVAKWIVESNYHNIQFKIHSMNPVGVQNIRQLLTHYGYKELN